MTYKFRKDNRTEKKFKQDIKKRAWKQVELMELFDKEMKRLCVNFDYRDNGVDNTGHVIKSSSTMGNADYQASFLNKPFINLEIKATPVLTKASFKKHSLKSCIKNGYTILLFINSKFPPAPADPNELYWAILNKGHIQQIHDLPTDHYITKKFGGKPSVQVKPLFSKFEQMNIPIRQFNQDYGDIPKELRQL